MKNKELREKFFKDCTRKDNNGITELKCSPHNVFEWIKANCFPVQKPKKSQQKPCSNCGTMKRACVLSEDECSWIMKCSKCKRVWTKEIEKELN